MAPTPFQLPADELEIRASRSGGPGGQHVNTSSTRVEVRWHVATSRVLSGDERRRVAALLASRIDDAGWIRVVASDSRSQHRNREAAIDRLTALVDQARRPPRIRRKTKVPAGERTRRLEAKRRRGRTKRERRGPADDE